MEELNKLRTLEYVFPKKVLDNKSLTIKSTFKNGNKEIKNLLMIENHFFGEKSIKSYEFAYFY